MHNLSHFSMMIVCQIRFLKLVGLAGVRAKSPQVLPGGYKAEVRSTWATFIGGIRGGYLELFKVHLRLHAQRLNLA